MTYLSSTRGAITKRWSTRLPARTGIPHSGSTTWKVLRELGLTDDEIEVLRTHHVIGETALKA
jgi:crotonobetainyl-CoA:carnitine CoA-transferase CaiB-like acyl-CoA transferase